MTPDEFFGRKKGGVGKVEEMGYFGAPNTTQTPNEFFDFFMAGMDEDELRVTLYLIRHLIGYGKNRDRIAIKQFIDGIPGQDCGCGIRGTTYKAKEHKASRALYRMAAVSIVIVYPGEKLTGSRRAANAYGLNIKEMKSVYLRFKSGDM